jgi:ribosomal protein L37AE/L43A
MSAEEKNRNENLSRIAAELFAASTGGEELSNKIQRLRDEIKKVIGSEDSIFGKFRGLVESFRDIIPEEKQRYHVAIKALSTTAKISPPAIVKALNNQIEELRILEKGLLSTPSGWRNELKVMEVKSREIRNEISKLREKIGRLESEEIETLNGMAAREKEMSVVEKAVAGLFTDMAAEITDINKKVEEFTTESPVSQPAPSRDSLPRDVPAEEKEGDGQKGEVREPSEPQDAELQKNCPMCGSRMHFHMSEQMWRCFSCAYEELQEEKRGSGRKSEISEPSPPQDTEWQKKCPMCGGQMNFHLKEQLWMCYSCAYEETKEGNTPERSEEKRQYTISPKSAPVPEPSSDPSPPLAVPLADLPSGEYEEPQEESAPSDKHSNKPSSKKKTCPVCRKKMNWHQKEKAWLCPFCEYERRI